MKTPAKVVQDACGYTLSCIKVLLTQRPGINLMQHLNQRYQMHSAAEYKGLVYVDNSDFTP
jgi:hypothetical protein